jgi:DNA mismatch repair ATPase MutS
LCLFFPFEFIVVWSNSRAYFDQDRGAEFLRRVSVTSIDSEVLARYTVLGAAFALLKYVETTSSLTFPRASVRLRFIDSNAGEFLTIDRRTAMGLEILANARSGDQKNCLFGTIDRTKVYQTVSACLICHFYVPSICISLSLSLSLLIHQCSQTSPPSLSLSLSI